MSGLMNKYDLGQEVWILMNNRAQKVSICSCDIHIRNHGTTVTYTVSRCCGRTGSISQCDLHLTKQDLLETL